MKEKFEVMISGMRLTIVSEEGEEYITSLADKLDRQISAVVMANKRSTKAEAAVFCALDCMDARVKAEGELEVMRRHVEAYTRDIEALKAENDELKKLLAK